MSLSVGVSGAVAMATVAAKTSSGPGPADGNRLPSSPQANADVVNISSSAQAYVKQSQEESSGTRNGPYSIYNDKDTIDYLSSITLNKTDQAYADVINSKTASDQDKLDAYMSYKTTYTLAHSGYLYNGTTDPKVLAQVAKFDYDIKDSGLFPPEVDPSSRGFQDTKPDLTNKGLSLDQIEQKGGVAAFNSIAGEDTVLQQGASTIDLMCANLGITIANGDNSNNFTDPAAQNTKDVANFDPKILRPITTQEAISRTVGNLLKELGASSAGKSLPGSPMSSYNSLALELISSFNHHATAISKSYATTA